MKPKTDLTLRSLVCFNPIAAITIVILMPLAGCGVGTTITGGGVSASTVSGRVHGGQQPIVGATVTLYAPGTGGYGSTPTVITTATAPTDSAGGFTLTRPYPSGCPANSPVTYIVATGGNSGAGDNANIALAALLPACSSLTASTFVWISEVTTVAAAYALAPFAALSPGTTNIGTSSTNLLGLTNALAPATNLADTTTGNAKGATSIPGIILPTDEINTLANILAACVNSSNTRLPSTTCATLFTEATPPGGVAPLPPTPSRPPSTSPSTPAITRQPSLVSSPAPRRSSPRSAPHPPTSPSASSTTEAPSPIAAAASESTSTVQATPGSQSSRQWRYIRQRHRDLPRRRHPLRPHRLSQRHASTPLGASPSTTVVTPGSSTITLPTPPTASQCFPSPAPPAPLSSLPLPSYTQSQ